MNFIKVYSYNYIRKFRNLQSWIKYHKIKYIQLKKNEIQKYFGDRPLL